jgi:hypothetical protein
MPRARVLYGIEIRHLYRGGFAFPVGGSIVPKVIIVEIIEITLRLYLRGLVLRILLMLGRYVWHRRLLLVLLLLLLRVILVLRS